MAKTTIKIGSSFEERIWIIYLWLPLSYVWYYFLVDLKVQMKCFFFIPEFERAAKIRKIAVYRFLISFLVPEL